VSGNPKEEKTASTFPVVFRVFQFVDALIGGKVCDIGFAERRMSDTNPYKAYVDDTILNESPVGLVVALYQGAIESSAIARKFMASGDIPARTKAINKTINIITELLRSLNDEKGAEVSANLRQLYVYMQRRVIEAHTKKQQAPLEEVERLLGTILEGWKVANQKLSVSPASDVAMVQPEANSAATQDKYGYADPELPYGGFFTEVADLHATSAYSF
jgi:flagellar protein FliS